VGIAHQPTSVEEHDECLVAIEEIVNLFEDIPDSAAACITKGHASTLPRGA
jgi:hypothetical protein